MLLARLKQAGKGCHSYGADNLISQQRVIAVDICISRDDNRGNRVKEIA